MPPMLMLALLSPALLSWAVRGAAAEAVVTGTVFCDQCRDGERDLFDYPLEGARVAVVCTGGDGHVALYGEATTNWFGVYCVQFDGGPDLSSCSAQVVSGTQECGAAAGPPGGLHLLFGLFGTAMYAADGLLALPSQPSSSCPGFTSPSPLEHIAARPPTPPGRAALPPPSLPFRQTSACPCETWTAPQYGCYWKMVFPDTKVAAAFGLAAARRYGTDMTLMEALRGRGDLYRTLLREAVTALLNSYRSLLFFYPTRIVIDHMNWALSASPRQALVVALRFKRANSGAAGYGGARCDFAPCD
ncbi:unnamed protein product [Spirodela intermedia]|uniref:Uncharacterized protein n=1 Tax=Spirodela intermedia TaxID=51605 RepID=A0A7I8K481_SPIIN|nr:unnamed protein product [Spirodela intermedia]